MLQGLGGAMIQPLGQAMIFQVAPPEQRGKLMGVYGLTLMLGPVLGPTLGGYLTEYVHWRWVFSVNLPIGVLGVLLGMVLLRETPTRRDLSFDAVGFGLVAVLPPAPALLAATERAEDRLFRLDRPARAPPAGHLGDHPAAVHLVGAANAAPDPRPAPVRRLRRSR